jgi:tetratricopeptide (TPR) repeat protein
VSAARPFVFGMAWDIRPAQDPFVASFARVMVITACVGVTSLAHAAQRGALSNAEDLCGPLMLESGRLGPCDYRVPTDQCPNNRGVPDLLRNVERNHFAPQVEQLEAGMGASLEQEIEYVLNVFPNHPGALASMARLAHRRHSERLGKMHLTATCWFVRAIAFTPDDARVHAIYGVHLSNFGRTRQALDQLLEAEKLGARDGNTMYNIGLLYFDQGAFERSLEYAKKAYAAGFPLPGLREKLQKAGKWHD